jgi:hypothetical protein
LDEYPCLVALVLAGSHADTSYEALPTPYYSA